MLSTPATFVFVVCCVALIDACAQSNRSNMDRDRRRQREEAIRTETLRQQEGARVASQMQQDAARDAQKAQLDVQRGELLALSNSITAQQMAMMASASPATSMPATGRKKRRALFGRKSAHFRRL
ncbi:hypothetical protein V3C99_007402 [Haemonchus contortus]